MELCTSHWEELSLMGVTTLLFLIVKMKKENSLMSLEEILYCGIKYWDTFERRVFKHYNVKVWLKVHIIATQILVSVNMVYMVRIIE